MVFKVVLSSLSLCLMTFPLFADDSRSVFGASLGLTIPIEYNKDDKDLNLGKTGFKAGAALDLRIVDAEVDGVAIEQNGENLYQVRASAGTLGVYIHDVTFRRAGADRNFVSAMAGVGVPGGFLASKLAETLPWVERLALSAGVAYFDWQLPSSASQAFASESAMWGGYVGGKLYVHFHWIKGEVFASYYASPKLKKSFTDLPTSADEIVDSWQKGFIGSAKLYSDKLSVKATPLFRIKIRPEIQSQLSQLPDGSEWMVLMGVSGVVGTRF